MKLEEYAQKAVEQGARCLDCQQLLTVDQFRHHCHRNGWLVTGLIKKQWLYFRCDCGCNTSFVRLGFPRV